MTTQIVRILSDLSSADATTEWRGFSDRVMGGISREQVSYERIDDRAALRLRGEVRIENNGGFIQMALPLRSTTGAHLDASAYEGIRLVARGNGEEYLVHLRNTQTRLPWQYFRASFIARDEWNVIDVPFRNFHTERSRTAIDLRTLTQIGIVAYGRRFFADIAIASVALYAD